VVEAGLDVSAHHLFSELPPWPSVIQRLGRLNRDGRDDDAQAWFWKTPKDEEPRFSDGVVRLGPYPKSELDDAAELLDAIIPHTATQPFEQAVAAVRASHAKRLEQALQPAPQPLPRAFDVHGLFSTERDVHGGFTDISAFVRNADPDADLTVFWRTWDGSAPPRRDDLMGPAFEPEREGCPVSFRRLAQMLENRKASAWLWNDEDETWAACRSAELRPGMVVMLHQAVGGYSAALGWTGDKDHVLSDVDRPGRGAALKTDRRSETGVWTSLSVHLADARHEAERLCDAVGLSKDLPEQAALRRAVIAAASWHDIGKAHPQWQQALPPDRPTAQGPWAKFIGGATPFRPEMRHEAASALAMWHRYGEGTANYPALAVYLAAAHHGKVRTVLRSTAKGGNDVFGVSCNSKALKIDGVTWPLDFDVAHDGAAGEWREDGFAIRGHGWTGLVADLLGPWRDDDLTDVGAVPRDEPRHLGPFVLAWLEALVRIADWRASERPSEAIILQGAADAA
jgi:CRISPR-associated endonuclease/helicase Cas3